MGQEVFETPNAVAAEVEHAQTRKALQPLQRRDAVAGEVEFPEGGQPTGDGDRDGGERVTVEG